MRIPLDYYQILGVSFNATPEQIQQSYEDRLQQLPKQQYSSSAITARKKLLQEAHGILLNPKRRQEHDQELFPDEELPDNQDLSLSTSTSVNQGVEIDSSYLSGALILLLEFGEFDAVLDLGLHYINRPIDLEKMPDETGPADDDVALAVSIANLELGREQWQQGNCETAGQFLQSGLKLLQEESKFFDIQAEIKTDLSKLRPYRVLELLALDQTDPLRDEGFSLLQDMLDDRGGMEGEGNDQSGLAVNDFLLFMQQLRDNLTVDEQLRLFRAESMRPSSVAAYLSAYAQIAQGVSAFAPEFIGQAKTSLSSLADRQNLSLEQAMCALLLGQPDAAVQHMAQSNDEEAIAFIQEYSEGAPDAIPGLYVYTEQWLQQEVYPYFRDLKEETVSLETYFNDEMVQSRLSELEPELPNLETQWDTPQVDAQWEQWRNDTAQTDPEVAFNSHTSLSTPAIDFEQAEVLAESSDEEVFTDEDFAGETPFDEATNWFSDLPDPATESTDTASLDLNWGQDLLAEDLVDPNIDVETAPQPNVSAPSAKSKAKKASSSSSRVARKKSRPNPKAKSNQAQDSAGLDLQKQTWVTWAAALLLGISVVWGGLALGRIIQARSNGTASTSESVQPTTPPVPTTPPNTPTPTASPSSSGELTSEAAQQILNAWQKIKAEALGKNHQVDPLGQILAEPELSRWQYSANISIEENKYTQYQLKNLQIETITMESPTQAIVKAKIEEKRDEYLGNSTSPVASLDDAYKVDYRLESIDGKWRIKEMKVLNE